MFLIRTDVFKQEFVFLQHGIGLDKLIKVRNFGNELFDYRFRLCCCTHLCHEPAADACRLGVLCVHGGTQHGI